MALRISTVFTLIAVIKYINSSCGPPGVPEGADIHGQTSMAKEGEIVTYECKDEFKQVYGTKRVCSKGRWTPRLPKCALRESSTLMTTDYKINYLDLRRSYGDCIANQSFSDLNPIELNSTKDFVFQLFYIPFHRISYIEFSVEFESKQLIFTSEDIVVNVFINRYRNCVKTFQTSLQHNNQIYFGFVCEANSFDDYNSEGNDLPNSIRFTFEYPNQMKSKINWIYVFRFKDDCGVPDIPLNAKNRNLGKTVSIYESKPERYKLLYENNDTIHCIHESNWDKEFPQLYPIIQCPTDQFDWGSGQYKNVEFEYFEYFNGTEIAATDSKIKFQCTYSQNESEVYYLYCNENGFWTRDQSIDICDNMTKIQSNETKTTASNDEIDPEVDILLPIIITLLSTFFVTIILVTTFGAIIIRRRKSAKNKKKIKELNENYTNVLNDSVVDDYDIVRHNGMIDLNHYETINYEAIGCEIIGTGSKVYEKPHFYTELFG